MRAHASAGARGLLFAGMGVTPRTIPSSRLRDVVPAPLRGVPCGKRRISSRRRERSSTRWTRAARVGHRDQQGGTLHDAGGRRVEPRRDGPERSFAATRRRIPSRIRHRCCTQRRALDLPAERCVYVGDDLRDVQAGIAGNADAGRALGLHRNRRAARDMAGHRGADRPLDVLDWLPTQRVGASATLSRCT